MQQILRSDLIPAIFNLNQLICVNRNILTKKKDLEKYQKEMKASPQLMLYKEIINLRINLIENYLPLIYSLINPLLLLAIPMCQRIYSHKGGKIMARLCL